MYIKCLYFNVVCSVSDPHWLNADPDPVFYLNVDLNPDPDPGSQTNADPDPDPGQTSVTKSWIMTLKIFFM
jgi:hypothetical protein